MHPKSPLLALFSPLSGIGGEMGETAQQIGFFDDPAAVITAAAQSPLGIVALVVVALALFGVNLFKGAPHNTKLIVWLSLITAMIFFVVLVLQTTVQSSADAATGGDAVSQLARCEDRPADPMQGTNLTIGPDQKCTIMVNYRALGTFVRGQGCQSPSEPIVILWKGQEINHEPLSNFSEASVNLEGSFTVPPGVEGVLSYQRPGSVCSDPKPGAFFGIRATISYR